MSKKLNILVVDDDKSIRDLFIRLLSKEHNLSTAEDGTEAIDLAKQQPFNLAFIDMTMPGPNGCETFIELKKIRPNITGIIMTGYTDKDLRVESFLAGTTKYIKKPFEISDIRKLVLNEADIQREWEERENRDP